MPIVATALCLAVVAAVTGCSDSSEAAGAGGCQSVGDVTKVSDGRNDVDANVRVPPPPAAPPGLDLEQAAVARSDSEVCAEWTLRRRPSGYGPFEWEVKTLAQPERFGPQYYDCAPEDGHNVAHPGGGIVELQNAAVCY